MNVRQHGIQPAISQPLPCDSSEFILKILIQSILTLFNYSNNTLLEVQAMLFILWIYKKICQTSALVSFLLALAFT